MSTNVVVGASVAGLRTAQALRSEGYTVDVVPIGEEHELSYDKPPLSEALLAGACDRGVALFSAGDAATAGIE